MKDLPASVPERRRTDGTVMIPGEGPRPGEARVQTPSDTAGEPVDAPSSSSPVEAPTTREIIVPTTTSTSELVEELRLRPAERLVFERRIAAGGMGAIQIATDRALDRRLAIKTLHPHLRANEASVRMFLREARLTALLDHPHIVPLYDIGERDNQDLYFAMKLIEGRTLHDIVHSLGDGPLDIQVLFGLLDVVVKVCDALAFAHSRGVIHCDVKPANVMVGEFGQVYLMDWGIARLVDVEPAPDSRYQHDTIPPPAFPATDNAVIGTPCCMSPEQARGERGTLDARSDVFLLGSLLYEVLARRPPYVGADRSEILIQAVSCSSPPLRTVVVGGVPPELERIVTKAMSSRPEDRYAQVTDLRRELTRFMRGGNDFPQKTFPAGSVIVSEGDSGDAAYIVVTGRCEVIKEVAPGQPPIIHNIGPGDVFGEMAILTEGPRTATVVAREDTTVLVVTSEALEHEMAGLKPWMTNLLKSLALRFRDADTKQRTTQANSPSVARMGNQMLMHLRTWGEVEPTGALSMSWSELLADLEAQLGVVPLSALAAAARYGMTLDPERDLLRIPDPPALATRLRRELSSPR